jgi:hypothetical protein
MSDAERIAALERQVDLLTEALESERALRRAAERRADAFTAHVVAGTEQLGTPNLPQVGGTFSKDWGRSGGVGRARRYAEADTELEKQGLYSAKRYVEELKISPAALARWEAAKPPVVKGRMRKVGGLSVKTFTQADVELGRKLREVQDEPVRRTLADAAAEARKRLASTATQHEVTAQRRAELRRESE